MNLAILGSTGSIGKSAVDLAIQQNYRVIALSCKSRAELLIEQYYKLKPKLLAVEDEHAYQKVKEALYFEEVEVLGGKGAAVEIAKRRDYDVILNAIVGYAGLLPAYEAVKSAKRLAIANKESLVVYGDYLMKTAREHGTEILPVDSEHSAIFQCLQGNIGQKIDRIILTASGGPFRTLSIEEIAGKKAREALKHPNWDMGSKISIDSATMMNKGLELIEAMRLFSVEEDVIEIVVHPESIVHSGVKFRDKSILCQLSSPDMKLPIQYAINYPNRIENDMAEPNLFQAGKLSFERPDDQKFPCLKIAREVARKGGFFPCILNSANEYAVGLYLKDKIAFYDINKIVESALSIGYSGDESKIEDILDCSKTIMKKLEEQYGSVN